MKHNKVILVDCDGVILDWEYAFTQWMERHGYNIFIPNVYSIAEAYNLDGLEGKRLVRMFNESATIRRLPPLRDAIKYIRKLHEEHGYVFHAITSLSNDQYAQHLRTKNLIELFGPTVFEKYTYLDCGADKDDALEVYKQTNCVWVEDKPHNADVGFELGLNSMLMAHEHNKNYSGPAIRVKNWENVYKLILQTH